MATFSAIYYFGKGGFKGVNVGKCAILQNSNDFFLIFLFRH